MKELLIISFAANLIGLGMAVFIALKAKSYITNIVTEYKTNHYAQKSSMFIEMEVQDNTILFLGDSIIEGANWDELFNIPGIINRGISGDTSEGVLNRMTEVISQQPAKLFIAIGTNDVSQGVSASQIITNYRSIMEMVLFQSPKTKIFAHSLLPVSLPPKSIYKHSNQGNLKVNEALQKLCSEKKVHYINIHPIFCDTNGNLKEEFTNDGLHLLGKGYLVWKEKIQEFIG